MRGDCDALSYDEETFLDTLLVKIIEEEIHAIEKNNTL